MVYEKYIFIIFGIISIFGSINIINNKINNLSLVSDNSLSLVYDNSLSLVSRTSDVSIQCELDNENFNDSSELIFKEYSLSNKWFFIKSII